MVHAVGHCKQVHWAAYARQTDWNMLCIFWQHL